MDRKDPIELVQGFKAAPVEDVFLDFKSKPNTQWFHLLGSDQDFPFIWTCGIFKFFTLCRCHQMQLDGTPTHHHVHALVSTDTPLSAWKQRLQRKKIRLYKTCFKPILCGDHMCGVLRYLCCSDGSRSGKFRPKHRDLITHRLNMGFVKSTSTNESTSFIGKEG